MKKYLQRLREEEGFTLIEMLIVIMIVSVLMLLVVTNVGGVEKTVTKTTDEGIIQTVESQMIIYEMKNNKEGSLTELESDGYISAKQLKAYKEAKLRNPNGS